MRQITHTQQDVIQSLATQLISLALKYHVIPWQNPVQHDAENCGLPFDVATQEAFDPVSTLLLQIAAQRKRFDGRWWGTADAWTELGGLVAHDDPSTWIAVPDKEDAYVYNIAQVVGEEVDQFRPTDCALIGPEEMDLGPLQQAVEKIGRGKSGLLSSSNSNQLLELALWVHSKIGEEVVPPRREMATKICVGWLATELRCPLSACHAGGGDAIAVWIEKMHRDPSWIFRVCERARRMMDLVLKV